MTVLIIGYGSIGKRHYEVLSSFKDVTNIDIVTKQNLENKKTFLSLELVKNLNSYDYFIISTQTSEHYPQLKYLETHLKNKIILCEKPLFETDKKLNIKNNTIYVGYTLRFHILMQELKELLTKEVVLSANASCGQYLPTWNPDRDYTKSYSAQSIGGGVLLDLSHEIDYVQWLFGEFTEIKSYQRKISDLKISSDDFTTLIGITNKNVIANITIDYISKITHRTLHVNTIEHSYSIDFINAKMIQTDKKGLIKQYDFSNTKTNDRYIMMHNSVLNKENLCCSYAQATKIMKTIKIIQDQK
ncbi:Gfo/Idh/MocA family protein [Sulfurimonas sp.]